MRKNSKAWVYRSCRRCGGDMYRENGFYDDDYVCLQCGYREYQPVSPPLFSLRGAQRIEGRLGKVGRLP